MNTSKSLWDYAVAVYSQAGVADECLWFQDHCGADVNLLLFICWSCERGGVVDKDLLDCVQQRVGAWDREVVVPLRALRRALKTDSKGLAAGPVSGFRDHLKSLELEAERVELDALQVLLSQDSCRSIEKVQSRQLILDGLHLYLFGLNDGSTAIAPERLERFVDAILG